MGGGFITLFKLLPGGQPNPRTHPAPKMLWWSNHSSVMAAQNNILLSLIRLPITHRRFVEIICGDAVVPLQKRRRAAIAVTRRSHARTRHRLDRRVFFQPGGGPWAHPPPGGGPPESL